MRSLLVSLITVMGSKPEVMNDLFTLFSTENNRGNGMGLPACKRIIETHGDKLTYDTV